jgi:asparagine N-glycosylation enzyme membrane subunit Stt3
VKATRVVAYLMAGIALVLSILTYINYVYMLGFPDGFISELGQAQRRLAYIFIVISVVLGAYFIYLGIAALQKKITRPLSVVVALYSLVIIAVLLVDMYYRSTLMGSGGG